MNKKYYIEIKPEDIYEVLKHKMSEDEAEKSFDSLTDMDIKEIVGKIYPFEIEDEIYNEYQNVIDEHDNYDEDDKY